MPFLSFVSGFLRSIYFCLQAGFIVKGIRTELFFLLYFLEKQDPFALALSSSSCFPPPPRARPGTVYCLGEYFMAFASNPHVHSFTLLLSNRMNK